jgi:hypothetical protein
MLHVSDIPALARLKTWLHAVWLLYVTAWSEPPGDEQLMPVGFSHDNDGQSSKT